MALAIVVAKVLNSRIQVLRLGLQIKLRILTALIIGVLQVAIEANASRRETDHVQTLRYLSYVYSYYSVVH